MATIADYDLGTARGRIEIDGSGAEESLEEVGGSTDAVVGKWQEASGALTTLGASLTGASAIIAAGFGYALVTAAEFEEQISAISAVSGSTGQELDSIREKALQLGADTAFSASEAALAMEELVKAGLPIADVLNGAADATVALAAAGSVSLPEAATLSANALNAFNLEASDAAHIADVVAGAANASAIDVGEFGQSLQQVGAVANLAGVSFDDTATAIALLGQAGIKGSDAGTSLKTFLSNLIPVTNKQKEAFAELGLVTEDGANRFFDAEGNLKSLGEVAGILGDSVNGLTAEQRQLALETLFGSDAIRAAAILSSEGAAGFSEMATAIGEVSAADVAATRLDNLSGAFEQLKGSLETAAIEVGSILLPAFQSLTDFLTGLVNKFSNLDPGIQTAIVAFVAIVAAIIGLIGVAITLGGIFLAFTATMAPLAAALGIGMGALLSIIAVVPLIIAAVVLLGIIIYKNWDTIKNFTIMVFNAVKDFLIGVWNSIFAFFSTIFAAISGAVTTAFGAIRDFFVAVWDAIYLVIATVVEAVAAVISTYINIWRTIIETVLGVITGVFEAVWGAIKGVVDAALEFIMAVIDFYLALWELAIDLVLLAILTIFKAVWDSIKLVVEGVLDAIKAVIEKVWGFIGPFIKGAVEGVRSSIEGGFNAARDLVSSILGAIQAVVETIWLAISTFISNRISDIVGFVGKIREIVGIITGAFGEAVSAVTDKVSEIIDIVAGIGGRVLSAIGNLGSLLYNAGKDIIQGLIDGVESMIRFLTDKLSAITDLIPDIKGPPERDKILLRENGQLIMQGLIGGIDSEVGSLTNLLGAISNHIPSLINTDAVIGGLVSTPSSAVAPSVGPQGSASGGNTYHIGEVLIPAADIAEMQSMSEFFDRIKQESRRRSVVRSAS